LRHLLKFSLFLELWGLGNLTFQAHQKQSISLYLPIWMQLWHVYWSPWAEYNSFFKLNGTKSNHLYFSSPRHHCFYFCLLSNGLCFLKPVWHEDFVDPFVVQLSVLKMGNYLMLMLLPDLCLGWRWLEFLWMILIGSLGIFWAVLAWDFKVKIQHTQL
jgi:hypothetical protein